MYTGSIHLKAVRQKYQSVIPLNSCTAVQLYNCIVQSRLNSLLKVTAVYSLLPAKAYPSKLARLVEASVFVLHRQPLCAQRGQLRRRCRLPAGSACLCALVALQPAGDWHASSLKCRRRTPGSARLPPPHRAHEFPSCRMDPDGLSAPRRTGCRAAACWQRQPAPARRAQRSSKKGGF